MYLLPDNSKSGKRKMKVKKHTLNPVFDETTIILTYEMEPMAKKDEVIVGRPRPRRHDKQAEEELEQGRAPRAREGGAQPADARQELRYL